MRAMGRGIQKWEKKEGMDDGKESRGKRGRKGVGEEGKKKAVTEEE